MKVVIASLTRRTAFVRWSQDHLCCRPGPCTADVHGGWCFSGTCSGGFPAVARLCATSCTKAAAEVAAVWRAEQPGCKVDVQDPIKQQGQQLWQLLEIHGAIVFVCGDARRMYSCVSAAFQAVADSRRGRSSSSSAGSWLGSMGEPKCYTEDE